MSLTGDIAKLQAGVVALRGAIREASALPDPATLMRAGGMEPDEWQLQALSPRQKRTLILVTRQGGKSTTVAGKALHTSYAKPGSLCLLVSPSLRQSQELFTKVVALHYASGEPVALDSLSALRLETVHGSRVIALPASEKTVRGYSGVDLLVIDEAARVLDEFYLSVRPMLAVSGGELVALTTPWGKRGWFYDAWTSSEDWQRIKVTAHNCPRISPEFLAEERRTMPAAWFESEYLCQFSDTVDSVFRTEDIEAARRGDVPLLFATDGPASAARADVPQLETILSHA